MNSSNMCACMVTCTLLRVFCPGVNREVLWILTFLLVSEKDNFILFFSQNFEFRYSYIGQISINEHILQRLGLALTFF
jgi:hypothetical protein